MPVYVVITPARDEAEFIELTIQSVIAQTIRPLKWVIVSDGSTDGTETIVERYCKEHSWIDLVVLPPRSARHFAGKVHAFNRGLERVSRLEFDVLASLDADISFEPEYFSFLLQKLADDPRLGLVGTPFRETTGETYDYRFVNIEHVSGACQVFRRKCFEEIGGYIPVEGGCIDYIAVVSSRMRGWKTRTFTEKTCLHHRAMDTAQRGLIARWLRRGMKDYSVGNHPCWELCRALRQMAARPYGIGGGLLLAGYAWSSVRQKTRPVSEDLIAFHRREQMHRLRRFVLPVPLRAVEARTISQRAWPWQQRLGNSKHEDRAR